MAYDVARLEQALINADKAGDVEAAKMLAAEIRKVRAVPQPQAEQAPEDTLQIANPFGKNLDTGLAIGKDTANFLAGAGRAFTNIGRRVGQVTGSVSEADIDEANRLDKPLLATKAGIAGEIGGNVAMFAPTAAIPGVNRVTGSGLVGALIGAAQPTGTEDSTLMNVLLGGVAGAGAQKVLASGAKFLGNMLAKKMAEASAKKAANAARDATIAKAKEIGLKIPLSEVKPGFVSNVLEKWAGKASIAQKASLDNQQAANAFARKALGLADDTPITPEALMPIKKAAWSVYDKVRSLGAIAKDQGLDDAIADIAKRSTKLNPIPGVDDLVGRLNQDSFNADDIVTAIQTFKGNANKALHPLNFDVKARNLAKAEVAAAEALEEFLDRHVQKTTGGALLDEFRKARVTLGKVGSVEKAMNEASGSINPNKLVKELEKGKLTGELKDLAKFSKLFDGKYTQQNVNPIQGGSPLDVATSMLGAGATASTGHPGFISTALSYALGRPAARSLALSRMLASRPNYSVGAMTRVAPKLLGNEKAQALARLLASIEARQE